MSSILRIASRCVLVAGPLLGMMACDGTSAQNPAAPTGIASARAIGQVRDTNGNEVPDARVHLYQGGSDSADSVVTTGPDGRFDARIRSGKLDIFVEIGDQGNRQGQRIHVDSLAPNAVFHRDTIRLVRAVTGQTTIPGLSGVTDVSANIQGSPLVCLVGNNGLIEVEALQGSESILTVTLGNKTGGHQVFRFRVTVANGKVLFQPITGAQDSVATKPAVPSTGGQIVVYQPGPGEVDDVGIIGNLHGTSSWDNTNFGARQQEGLGGAWDGNTVGRALWHYRLPDSLKGRQVLSARLEYQPAYWAIRPTGGQDLTVEGYRMLRTWKEGHGAGQNGEVVSTTNDGASAHGPSLGAAWNREMVGLDGVDAQAAATTRSTLAYKSLDTMSFDITSAVQGWLADPATNFGLLFRSTHEDDGQYLDYPGFHSNDDPAATTRPRLVLLLAPKSADPAVHLLTLQPGPGGHDAAIIGTFSGTGSHDGINQGTVAYQSLGGSWDYNTVGRLLWKLALPDSLAGKTILSATAVFKVEGYMGRPVTGHDYKVEAYRLLRTWKEGAGVFPGQSNSTGIDGATSLESSFGVRWNQPLVGLDGVDADSTPAVYSVLPYGDTTSIAFDFTQLVKGWLARPASNNGVLFRSLEELDPSFPDYPGFGMSEDSLVDHRPKLVIQYR
jgi:hypothetical protein